MGQFDITPVDPMGTLQDWRQVQANTQISQEQAQQQSLVTKQTQMALQQAMQQKKQEDQLLGALQKIPQSLPIYEQMGERSRLLMEAGKFKEAETVVHEMNLNLYREGKLEAAGEAAEAKRFATAQKKYEFQMRLASDAKTPAQFAMGMQAYEKIFGEKPELGDYAFTPETQAWAKSYFEKKLTAGQEALQSAQTERAKAAAEKDLGAWARTQAVIEGRKEVVDTRLAARTKAGAPQRVSPDERKLVGETMTRMFPEISGANKALGVSGLTLEAKDYQNQNGGTFEAALAKVIASDPNRFVVKEAKDPFFGAKQAASVEIKPAAPAQPPPADKSQLKIGAPYKMPDGVTAYWTGNGFSKTKPGGQ